MPAEPIRNSIVKRQRRGQGNPKPSPSSSLCPSPHADQEAHVVPHSTTLVAVFSIKSLLAFGRRLVIIVVVVCRTCCSVYSRRLLLLSFVGFVRCHQSSVVVRLLLSAKLYAQVPTKFTAVLIGITGDIVQEYLCCL